MERGSYLLAEEVFFPRRTAHVILSMFREIDYEINSHHAAHWKDSLGHDWTTGHIEMQILKCKSLYCNHLTPSWSKSCSIRPRLDYIRVGVIRGSGRQMLAAIINILTYWGLGVTAAWLFAFTLDYKVMGFWYARLLATAVQVSETQISYLYILKYRLAFAFGENLYCMMRTV